MCRRRPLDDEGARDRQPAEADGERLEAGVEVGRDEHDETHGFPVHAAGDRDEGAAPGVMPGAAEDQGDRREAIRS